jgi:hypothetical protein
MLGESELHGSESPAGNPRASLGPILRTDVRVTRSIPPGAFQQIAHYRLDIIRQAQCVESVAVGRKNTLKITHSSPLISYLIPSGLTRFSFSIQLHRSQIALIKGMCASI